MNKAARTIQYIITTSNRNDVYELLYNALNYAVKFSLKILRKKTSKYDYAYIHFKETDMPGHDNKPLEKRKMIELLDEKFFSELKKLALKKKIRVVVAADHSTPCKLKEHSSDPVPVLAFDNKNRAKKRFTENDCKNGELGKIYGKEFLKKIGFVK